MQVSAFPAFQAGYGIGLRGTALPALSSEPAPAEFLASEWNRFLSGIRSKEISPRGPMNEGAKACADAFFQGALEVFPEAKDKVFLRTLSRAWGATLSPAQRPLAAVPPSETLAFSADVARLGAKLLRADYEAGEAAGFGKTVLDAKLHLRDMQDYLRVGGWLAGTAEFLKPKSPERSAILAQNHASILHRAFHRGDPNYPVAAEDKLPAMLQCLDLEIARWETSDPDAAEVLRSNRSTIVSRALHSGNLDYPGEAIEALPTMVRFLNREPARLEAAGEADAARALRSNRASILSRAFNSGNFRYPEEVVKNLSALLRDLDKEIAKRTNIKNGISRILRENRSSIITRALANGNFKYGEEAAKTLRNARATLQKEIRYLKRTDPKAAEFLAASGPSILSRTLNSNIEDYPAKAAKALPSMLRALDEGIEEFSVSAPAIARILEANTATIVHRAIASGDLRYVEKALSALSRKPGLLKDIRKTSRELARSHPEWAPSLKGAEEPILAGALRDGVLDAAVACRNYLSKAA